MSVFQRAKFLLQLTRTHDIVRRYFIVNGFDGALTMLGLIIGFLLNDPTDLSIVISVCVGAAIALGMSGLSSAYVSEVAERKRALEKLESAMMIDLQQSTHGDAARWVPIMIALVNGLAPLGISLLILIPLWLAEMGVQLPLSPLYMAIIVALALIFFLGVVIGRIASISWFTSGIQTCLLAVVTTALIYLFAG